MMNIVVLLRNRLFILVLALLGVLMTVSFAFVWPTPAIANDKISSSTESVNTLDVLNMEQSKVNEKTSNEKTRELSSLLARATVFCNLRDMLAKYGVSSQDTVTLNFSVDNKEPVMIMLPKGDNNLSSEPTNKSLREALFDDFYAPADALFNLTNSFIEAYEVDIPDPRRALLTLTLEVNDERGRLKSKTVVVQYCAPCPEYFPYPWC